MRNNQVQILKRLREEYQQQAQAHEKMIQDENEYYQSSKAMEIQRHNEAIAQLERNHTQRMQSVKEQEDEYLKQILDIRMRHNQEKKKLERSRQHEIQMIEESKFPIDTEKTRYEDPEIVPDAAYAEAVLTELLRLRHKNNDGLTQSKKSMLLKKIRDLSEAIDSQTKILRSVLARTPA